MVFIIREIITFIYELLKLRTYKLIFYPPGMYQQIHVGLAPVSALKVTKLSVSRN